VIAMVKRARLFRLQRYVVRLDGRTRAIRAAEVVISSTTMLEKPPYLFGPPETLGDGQLEVYVVTARTLNDYMRLTWNLFFRSGRPSAKLSHWTVRKGARIDCARRPSLVQADGELIGRTPVEIHLLQRALNVIVPRLVPKPV
jgi:diacylglycerol kinase (ATP)